MAYTSSKSRLVAQLSRTRNSSPQADEFATANSFTVNNDQLLHSTINMDQPVEQQRLHHPFTAASNYAPSENGSDGGSEMSIEIGRGLNESPRKIDHDVSSNLILNFGGDSQYEITGTPPIRPRNSARKSDGQLRKDASVRYASRTMNGKDAAAPTARRSLSETLAKVDTGSDEDVPQPTVTLNARNTRFTRSRQVSANQESTPRRAPANNPTVQSATYTANSFMLPDLPNITELVSGVRKDGTPVFNRATKSRSRFTSGSYKPTVQHTAVETVPIPEEEKAIFASLQLLQDKIAALELEKSEAQKRAEEYESEIIDLRSQLQAERRRPDSALGSDEETSAREKWRMERTRLQASVKALQDRLDRSERKISVGEIAVKRVTRERDELVTQMGVAYYNNEELKAENELYRETHVRLQAENEEMKEETERLRLENEMLVKKYSKRGESAPKTASRLQDQAIRSEKETKALDLEDIASRISREVQKHRADAEAAKRQAMRARSKSRQRDESVSVKRRNSERRAESRLEEDHLAVPRMRSAREPTQEVMAPLPGHVDDDRDITYLSIGDPREIENLRRKLEKELAAKHGARGQERGVSANVQSSSRGEETVRSNISGLQRKSSLRNIHGDGTGRFSLDEGVSDQKLSKSVRVQSPHMSDASALPAQQTTDVGDISTLSNTSRRRRRALSAEGMTSAFILPDITLHASKAVPANIGADARSCIQHNAVSCTMCRTNDARVNIPTPVPVTDRETPQDQDVTTATIRPSQPPALALATVIKNLEDEVKHLKLQLETQQRLYHQHDPALSKRQRIITKCRMQKIMSEIERRSDQIYALYDVLEGQKQAAAETGNKGDMAEEEIEETLMSVGIDPAEISGRMGRTAPFGLDGADELSEGEDLPWEGLSDEGSDVEVDAGGRGQRWSSAF